jgi:hypothetical protein
VLILDHTRFGLWMRLGLVGAYVLAAAVFHLFDTEADALTTIGVAACRGGIAALGWWRARAVLERVDASPAVPARASASANPVSVGTA